MKNIFYVLILLLFFSCSTEETKFNKNNTEDSGTANDKIIENNQNPVGELPKASPLSNYPNTVFVPTLESEITPNKNIIYAPAFLFAWEKVKQELKNEIIADKKNSKDFTLINFSKSYQNSLNKNEYTATSEINDSTIIAKAFFNKTLPFNTILDKFTQPFIFDNMPCSYFGMEYYNGYISDMSKILYYKNDNQFILKLIPKDNNDEIILIKGLDNGKNLLEILGKMNVLMKKGKEQIKESKYFENYIFKEKDIFAIPIISFNIFTNYNNIERQTFTTTDKKRHIVEVAYQRTGFVLNEKGAIVESEALAVADSLAAKPKPNTPKKLIFDKQFYIIIKKVNQKNPYFVMKVENSELLIPYKK